MVNKGFTLVKDEDWNNIGWTMSKALRMNSEQAEKDKETEKLLREKENKIASARNDYAKIQPEHNKMIYEKAELKRKLSKKDKLIDKYEKFVEKKGWTTQFELDKKMDLLEENQQKEKQNSKERGQ